jgi:hypothetical protein
MRVSSFSLLAVLLALSFGTCVSAQASIPNTFPVNLSLGSSGAQVLVLQQILNRDSDTRIASTGPGSTGNETSYFGSLTKAAVVRFQEKYTSDVLAPAGLAQGNGYVGFYTRIKLDSLSASSTASAGLSAPSSVVTSTITSQNPNLQNLDAFITAIDNAAAKQGMSADAVAAIKQQVLKDVATTTDLRTTFLKIVQDSSHQSAIDNSFTDRVFASIERAFDTIFVPERARAATSVPFGGALLFAYFCNCSSTWLLTLEPLPPSYADLLTYTPGSQAFLSHNIPATDWLLGEYAPGVGVCLFIAPHGCGYIPSDGMITPVVGSSPT